MANDSFDVTGWKNPAAWDCDFADLPKGPGIYVIVRPSIVRDRRARMGERIIYKLLYVGMSKNLAQRLQNHPVKRSFDLANDYVQVWFIRVPPTKLRRKEKALIQEFHPPYNSQHRLRGEA